MWDIFLEYKFMLYVYSDWNDRNIFEKKKDLVDKMFVRNKYGYD